MNFWTQRGTEGQRYAEKRKLCVPLYLCITLCPLFILLFLSACSQTGQTWERIEREGILRVGLDPTYPPFEHGDGIELQGIDIDLANAIADELGLEVQFTLFGYDGLYDALATYKVDVLISGLVVQPERTRDFAYSDAYFDAGQVMVIPAGSTLTNPEQLANQAISVELGAEGHVLATTWARRVPDLTILPYNTPDEALDALPAGTANAAFMDNISASLYLADHSTLTTTNELLTSEPFSAVVRIDDSVLLERLNEQIRQLHSSGQLQEIIDHWMSQ